MLEVNAIDTYRGPAHILSGVSLRVDKEEVVCLVGRNGAGKTTAIESIMGFLPVRAGQILFHDEDVTALPPHERAKRGIGYSPEDCGVFPDLSVSENLMISRWLGDEVANVDLPWSKVGINPPICTLYNRPPSVRACT